MNATVDVLHAIDQADVALATAGLSVDNIFREELREARHAVRELIEAANSLATAAAYSAETGHLFTKDSTKIGQMRAALARIGGAT